MSKRTFYKYKSNYYKFIRFVKFKHPDTGEWLRAVEYRQLLKGNDDIYIREVNDFSKKFEQVEREDLIGK